MYLDAYRFGGYLTARYFYRTGRKHLPRAKLALAVCVAVACSDAIEPIVRQPTPPQPTWIQTWSDEFDGAAGTRIDGTKWRHDIGDGCSAGICGWGNNEKEYYTDAPENIALNGQGQLMIVARRAPEGLSCYYGSCRYTSAKVTTRGTMLAPPGRVEARIKLSAGQGLWAAFWMLGQNHPTVPWPASGEIDVMENRGSDPVTSVSAIHGPGYSGATPFAHSYRLAGGSLAAEFHTFAVEWDASQVRFYVDGLEHYRTTASALEQFGQSILNQSFYLILNLAVGGGFDGDPRSDEIFPATMLVDYVRVFVKEPAAP